MANVLLRSASVSVLLLYVLVLCRGGNGLENDQPPSLENQEFSQEISNNDKKYLETVVKDKNDKGIPESVDITNLPKRNMLNEAKSEHAVAAGTTGNRTAAPEGFPRPQIYRWFPEHNGAPTDVPEETTATVHTDNDNWQKAQLEMLHQNEISETTPKSNETLLLDSLKKLARVRRAVSLTPAQIRRRRRRRRRRLRRLQAAAAEAVRNSNQSENRPKPTKRTWSQAKTTSKWKTPPKPTRSTGNRQPKTWLRPTPRTKTLVVTTRPKIQQKNAPSVRSSEVKNPRVSFSKWGEWMLCDAECGQGKQMRTRTCYGDNLTAADYATCKYNNLVDFRPCQGPPCPSEIVNITTEIWSQWSEWSKCSVSCGRGGTQKRSLRCFKLRRSNNGSTIIHPETCRNKTLEYRACQYSVSCPTWSEWQPWNTCSKSCGLGGLTHRERKCVVERYVSFRIVENNMDAAGDGSTMRISNDPDMKRLFDAKSASPKIKPKPEDSKRPQRPKVTEPKPHGSPRWRSGTNSNAVLPPKPSSSKQMIVTTDKEIVFVTKENIAVYFAKSNLPRRENDVIITKALPEFHDKNTAKEFVNIAICVKQGGTSEEEKKCIVNAQCPSMWEAWGPWSPCSATCGSGISKAQRKCSTNSVANPCKGRKYSYRRCYSPPCWGSWSPRGPCSGSCGSKSSVRVRKRECLGASTIVPEYRFCVGKSAEEEPCGQGPCNTRGHWTTWSRYGPCSKSCGRGTKRRFRYCDGKGCIGHGEDSVDCQPQACPTWAAWSHFSCCNVSCGRGTKSRKRSCLGGTAGMKGCNGESIERWPCYMRHCNKSQTPVFPTRCGVGGAAKLKRIAILRIFGGRISTSHDWPWQVSWQHRNGVDAEWQHFCGATLIAARWVVTASHCTEESEFTVNHEDPGYNWSVVIGMDKLYRDGERYFVETIFVHPHYEYRSVTKNDIALLKLRRMVPFSKNVMPVCMPGFNKPMPGERCTITGWGYTTAQENGSLLSLSLREAAVPIMKFSDCRNLGDYYRYFLEDKIHMCAGNPVTASTDSCTGDSGGPMVCASSKRWYLAAITSFGFATCGTRGHVGIYAPMSNYKDWIRNTVEAHNYDQWCPKN